MTEIAVVQHGVSSKHDVVAVLCDDQFPAVESTVGNRSESGG